MVRPETVGIVGEKKNLAVGDQSTKADTATERNQMDVTCFDSGAGSTDVKRYEVGGYLGKYQIVGYLGRGGMGVVYRGFDPLVERDVALKVLPSGLSVSPQARQRFLAEARAIGKLNHPNATALYEVGETDGSYFLAMEFVGGGSIANLLDEQKCPVERATRYLAEICFGLAAAHEVGLIHRDIKPENLLRTSRDHIKITDFGLAKVLDALSSSSLKLTNPGSMLGTPLYMSPEQFSGGEVDSRCDIYSTGATYLHMLTGKPPYSDCENLSQLMYAHCQRPIPDPRAMTPLLPAACTEIVRRAMSKRPEDRYESADDMAHAAMVLLGELGGTDAVSLSDSHHGLGDAPARLKLSGSAIRLQPTTMWLVEPSRMQARVLQQHLTELGVAHIQVFATIGETIAGLADKVPSGILSAMHLDDGSGDDLATQVRKHARGSAIPCFLISSSSSDAAAGANDPHRPLVLQKPVTKEMLAEVLKRIAALPAR